MNNNTGILGIPLSNITKSELLDAVSEHFERRNKNLFIITANPEILLDASRMPDYKNVLLEADYLVPDGIGVMIASRIMRKPLREKMPGYELMHDFLAYSVRHNKTVYFYGAKPGYAEQAALNAEIQYPGVNIVGFRDGYGSDRMAAAREIAAMQPDFVFVAMGAPIQEQWIADAHPHFESSVMIGVGGSIDVLSGNVRRAPKFWVNNHLEWFYRLITQPWRAKRMAKIPVFLWLVIKDRFKR